jgi:hypothetical protein
MANRTVRLITRLIHLIGGAVLALYIYSPLGGDPVFSATVQWVTIPLLIITGIVLWQQPRLVRLLRRNA